MNNTNNTNANDRGFTLIELLVVIVVISALTGIMISVINPGKLRARTRDGQRVADLKQIQTALELYYSDNRAYPDSANAWLKIMGSDFLTTQLTSGGYINKVPLDPKLHPTIANSLCAWVDEGYRYVYRSDGTYYFLTAYMEDVSSNDGHECSGLGALGCALTADLDNICYGVQNP